MKKLNEIFDVELLNKILKIVGIVLSVFVIFGAGVVIGIQKSNFGKNWNEHYRENFGMVKQKKGGMMGGFNEQITMMNFMPNAHGAIGKIIKIQLPNIIVADSDNLEKVILIKEDTKIQEMRAEIKSTDLKIDDFVVIIGSPNELGQIEAKLIRLMPAPELIQ